MSGQSGFVLYHVAKARPGALRYFDRFALVTRDFLDCPVSAGLPHTTWGLFLTVERYLGQMDEFEKCGISPPDVIYELFRGGLPAELEGRLADAGYTLRYLQDRDATAGSALLPGRSVGRVYIAVRQPPSGAGNLDPAP